jgi:hypothetical protein
VTGSDFVSDPISGLAGEREDLQGRQGDGARVLVGFHQLRHRSSLASSSVHQLVGVHQLRQLHQFISFVWVENEESDREGEGERENKIK